MKIDETRGVKARVDKTRGVKAGVDETGGVKAGVDETVGVTAMVDETRGVKAVVDETGGVRKTGAEGGPRVLHSTDDNTMIIEVRLGMMDNIEVIPHKRGDTQARVGARMYGTVTSL